MSRLLFLIGILLLSHQANLLAHSDEDPPSKVAWFTHDMFFNPFSDLESVDTTISGFQRYDFYDRESFFWAGKGNVGHVARIIEFKPLMVPEFNLFANGLYPGYLLEQERLVFYRPEHVFSELFYVTGSEREQLFYAMHNQRLHESIYAGLKYQTVNSPGPFSRMGTRNAAVELKLDVELGDRYGLLGTFVLNRLINQESGGLKNHLHFEEDEVRDSVFLYNATSRYRDIGFGFNQYFIAKPNSKDTENGKKRTINLGVFRHEFSWHRSAFVFDEKHAPSTVFYDLPAVNNTLTYDSTLVYTVKNKLLWSNFLRQDTDKRFPFHFSFSVCHMHVRLFQPALLNIDEVDDYSFHKQKFSQFEHEFRLSSDPKSFISFEGYAKYITGGYNDQDYGFGGNLSFGRKTHDFRLRFEGGYAEKEAPWFLNTFYGNYIQWDNDFRKTRSMNLTARIMHPKLQLFAGYNLLNRAVFMNAEALPEQHQSTFSFYIAGLKASLNAGFFRSEHKIMFQYTAEQQFDRYPAFVSYHSLYADFMMFDNAMHTHAGFDLRYNAPYKPMAYMPVARQFYLQDNYESSHKFLLDVFVNAKISRARLFVKLQNILGVAFNIPQYYSIPFYPLPEGMFKFGVSWMFFD